MRLIPDIQGTGLCSFFEVSSAVSDGQKPLTLYALQAKPLSSLEAVAKKLGGLKKP